MNIKNIIIEEIKRLFEQDVYTIPQLSKLLSRQGHDPDSIKIIQKILFDKYNQSGDQGVIDTYTKISGVQIEALRNGRYMFANLYTPENHEGHLE